MTPGELLLLFQFLVLEYQKLGVLLFPKHLPMLVTLNIGDNLIIYGALLYLAAEPALVFHLYGQVAHRFYFYLFGNSPGVIPSEARDLVTREQIPKNTD